MRGLDKWILLVLAGTVLLLVGRQLPVLAVKGKELLSREATPAAKGKTDIPYHPLNAARDLDILLKEIGNARVVMLGEASHGTSEYYTWRTAITKRLIVEKGFRFIAVEGDWPDCAAVDRYIKGLENQDKKPETVLQAFNRWPTWMWANWEMAALVDWLRNYNQGREEPNKIGFYGLDLYSLCESLKEITAFLEKRDGAALPAARRAVQCFQPFGGKPEEYIMHVASRPEDCRKEVVEMLKVLRDKAPATSAPVVDPYFDADQNAVVAVNAERYYRSQASGSDNSWNIRDRHMMQTLNRLLKQLGPDSKAIIWAHNTHVGDARYTDMARGGEVNIGQLARQELGAQNVYVIGTGSYSGTVLAASAWDEPVQKLRVPEARKGSWEDLLHQAGKGNKLLLSRELREAKNLSAEIGHRAIGVVYNPAVEKFGNYVPTIVPKRYDAFLFLDHTEALHELTVKRDSIEPPSLYPWVF